MSSYPKPCTPGRIEATTWLPCWLHAGGEVPLGWTSQRAVRFPHPLLMALLCSHLCRCCCASLNSWYVPLVKIKKKNQGIRESETKKTLCMPSTTPPAPGQLLCCSLPSLAAGLKPTLAQSRCWAVGERGNTVSPWWGTASHCFPVFAPLGHFWVGMDDDTPVRGDTPSPCVFPQDPALPC